MSPRSICRTCSDISDDLERTSGRVFARAAPTDLRKGYEGLSASVREDLGRDPASGDLFVFLARNRIRANVLLWDGTGLCVAATPARRLLAGRPPPSFSTRDRSQSSPFQDEKPHDLSVLDIDREPDPETLRLACRAYDTANRRFVETVQRLTREVAELQGLDSGQVQLELPSVVLPAEPMGADEEKISESRNHEQPTEPRARCGHGPTSQLDLPKAETHHRFVRGPGCNACDGTMQPMEGQFEDSEEITVVEST